MEFFLYAPNQTRLATDRFVSDTGELSITAPQAGTYYLEVTTDRSEATTDYSIQSTQTGDSNTPPTAAFTSSQLTPPVGESITFDASNSTDSDGQIERYEWDFDGDGTVEASGETVTHTYNNAGNYTATLTVSDTTGLSATTSQIITVEEQDNRLNVENDGVSITGSEIRISVEDRSSFTVTGLPSDVSVSPGDNGIYDSSTGEIRYESPTAQLPATVTFTLTPGESYEFGDTIEFTVDGESVSLPVTEAPTVPTQLADEDVSAASYNAVVGSDDQLGAGNLAAAIQSWAGDDGSEQGFIGDTDVGAGELSSMINYWASEIAG